LSLWSPTVSKRYFLEFPEYLGKASQDFRSIFNRESVLSLKILIPSRLLCVHVKLGNCVIFIVNVYFCLLQI
jgi:hypothetical protein